MPLPTLDQFRAFLDHFDETDHSDVLAFFQYVAMMEEESLEELGPRLQKSQSPRGLRFLIMEAAYYHPWAGWVDYLAKVLRHEADFEIFSGGTRALASINTAEANQVLKELHNIRQSENFQAAVSAALSEADPHAAFAYHLGRLLQGSANTRVANEAAAELTRVLSVTCLPQLLVAVQHADLLVARHALRLITQIRHAEAAQFLLGYLQEHHQMVLDDRLLKETIALAKGPKAKSDLAQRAAERFGQRLPDAAADLVGGIEEGTASAVTALQRLRSLAEEPYEKFLVDGLACLLEGKPAKLTALLTETTEAIHLRGRRTGFAVDTAAEGLGGMIQHKAITVNQVLPMLCEAYHEGTGKEGLARVLGHVVSPDDEETLQLIMEGQDSTARGAAIEAIGSRKLETMLPFLLMACRDPIVDIAQRAMLAMGKLHGAIETVSQLLRASKPEDIHLGIQVAAINRMPHAMDVLLTFLKESTREDLTVEAVEALGSIGKAEAGDALLDMLHTGQSPRVQMALARAIRDMGQTDLAFSLSTRVMPFKNPQLNLVAAEAFLIAHPDRERAMPAGAVAAFREQVAVCWNDPNPWPLRARLLDLLEQLHCQVPSFYEEMATLVQAALGDKRCQSGWSLEQISQANNVVRELTRKAGDRRR